MTDYIHPDLREALHFDEDADWRIGMPNVKVCTKSGVIYEIDSKGMVTGGSKDIEEGELSGAVYRRHGPIRLNEVVVGMSMEISWKGKILVTSPVIAVIFKKEKK